MKLRYRIIPSVRKRIASEDPPSGKYPAPDCTVFFNCLQSIIAAGRVIRTPGRFNRRQIFLIFMNGPYHDLFHIVASV